MRCLVDWLSFTVPLPSGTSGFAEATQDYVFRAVHGFTDNLFLLTWDTSLMLLEKGRGFYAVRYHHQESDMSVSVGETNAHAFVEFSGVGCQWLRDHDILYTLIEKVKERVTRIDIAVDMETETTPATFVAQRSGAAFTTIGEMVSPTGATAYVGSRKGERMARVYRYYPPHPRAQYLRAEVEYKGGAAKSLAALFSRHSLISCTLAAHAPFSWQHPAWTPDVADVPKIPSKRHDREGAATLRWLLKAVAPSIRKAHQEGLINAQEWVADNILAPLGL